MSKNETIRLKSMTIEGIDVELVAEGPSLYRVNINDGAYNRTRVFVDYAEASALFDSYLQGN